MTASRIAATKSTPEVNANCPVCGKLVTTSCTKCLHVMYCSVHCGREDAPNHKLICDQIPDMMKARLGPDYCLALFFPAHPRAPLVPGPWLKLPVTWSSGTPIDPFSTKPLLVWVHTPLNSSHRRGIHAHALLVLLGDRFTCHQVAAHARVDPSLSPISNDLAIEMQAKVGIGVEPYLFHSPSPSFQPFSAALTRWVGAKALQHLVPGSLLVTGMQTLQLDDAFARSADVRDFQPWEMRKLRHAFDLMDKQNQGELRFCEKSKGVVGGFREVKARFVRDGGFVMRFQAQRFVHDRIGYWTDYGPREGYNPVPDFRPESEFSDGAGEEVGRVEVMGGLDRSGVRESIEVEASEVEATDVVISREQ